MNDESRAGGENLLGEFRGAGVWRDSAGNKDDYDVVLTIRTVAEGLAISQRHVLRDGSGSDLAISLTSVAPLIYRVDASGQDGGYGFVMPDIMQFWFNNHLGSITEIGFHAKTAGGILTYGFTNRNSAGNYIMWHEDLERVGDRMEVSE